MLSKVRVKYIQSLGQKKGRDIEESFIAEGPKIVDEFLTDANVSIKQVYAVKTWMDKHKDNVRNAELIEIEEADLERISQLKTPNDVLAIVSKFKVNESIDLKNKITLALDTIQDPGNMGTIIRIADWFGIKTIVCNNESADIYNSKVVQSTMGSIARVQVIYADLENWLKKNEEINIYAAALSGKPVNSFDKITQGILVIGNESKGIDEKILSLVKEKISIPGIGKAESLNAAVSAGIILSHITSDR